MIQHLTSYNDEVVSSGTVQNDVKLEYNTFAQLSKEWQDHGAAVSGSSPNVQYAYDSGASSSNEIRPTTLTYPNARAITYDYGTSGGMDDHLNRIENIKDSTTTLAAYTYLGSGTVIRIDYSSQPTVRLDLWGGTSGTFNGFDIFGRIVDQQWRYYGGTPADRDRYKYGYDRDSNRQWRQNTVGSTLDEYYTYDNLNRLSIMQRGTLTGTPPTGISGTPVREMDYTLDPTGNWRTYVTKTSGTTDLNQTRTSNTVNEITNFTQSVGTLWTVPAYDANGNTTTLPQGIDPTQSYTALYDAWNRLTTLTAGANTVAKYQYDGRNRRAVKLTYVSGVLSETRHFYYTNQWQDIEERTGTSTSADQQYVWGIRYVDELICRDKSSTRIYAMQDANFNLTGIIDTSGTVLERYRYDPYGARTIMNPTTWATISSSAYSWAIGHQGLMHDDESGLIYNRERYLHPLLGRFLQYDPLNLRLIHVTIWSAAPHDPNILLQNQASNLYAYELPNPLHMVDPDGLVSRSVTECWQYWISSPTTGLKPALLSALKKAAYDCAVELAIGKTRPTQGDIYKCIAGKLQETISDNLKKFACCMYMGTQTPIDIDTNPRDCIKHCNWDACLDSMDLATSVPDPTTLVGYQATLQNCLCGCAK